MLACLRVFVAVWVLVRLCEVVRPQKFLVHISDTGKLGMELKYKDLPVRHVVVTAGFRWHCDYAMLSCLAATLASAHSAKPTASMQDLSTGAIISEIDDDGLVATHECSSLTRFLKHTAEQKRWHEDIGLGTHEAAA